MDFGVYLAVADDGRCLPALSGTETEARLAAASSSRAGTPASVIIAARFDGWSRLSDHVVARYESGTEVPVP